MNYATEHGPNEGYSLILQQVTETALPEGYQARRPDAKRGRRPRRRRLGETPSRPDRLSSYLKSIDL